MMLRKTPSLPLLAGAVLASLALMPGRATAVEPLKTVPPPAPATQAPTPAPINPSAELPAAPVYGDKTGPMLLTNPVEAMTDMVGRLEKQSDKIVAEVDGRPIYQGEVADMIRSMPISLASLGIVALSQRAMDQLIRQKVMVIAAEKAGLDKDAVVKRRVREAAERTLAEEWIRRAADTAVTEQEIRKRYERDYAGKSGPEEVRGRIILTRTEPEARDAIAKLQAGTDFGDLARKVSKDASAASGGDLGFVRFEALGSEVGSVLFSLPPGQTAAYPVRTQVGYFVIRAEGRRQRPTPTFDEMRGLLLRDLLREAANTAVAAEMAKVGVRDTRPKP